jgi:rhodanese-related sulfurtransferase
MNRLSLIIGAMLLAGPALAADPAPAAAATAPSAAPSITQAQLLRRIENKDDSVVVLDVRTPREFAAGHVPGARNISHDELAGRLEELADARDKEIVLYCRSGRRSALAAETLRGAGFARLRQLEGDYPAWEAGKLPIESAPRQGEKDAAQPK